MSVLAAEAEFEQAWADPRATRAEFPPVDVNQVLAERYVTSEPVHFTRAMLWDLETRKAAAPGVFIPYVVRSGSDASWAPGRPGGALGDEFVRSSDQRLWAEPEVYGLVLEEVYLDQEQQTVTFLGRAEFPDADGAPLHADPRQPLFHVQHGVAGGEQQPLNTWRIVLLTEQPDAALVARFTEQGRDPWLPGFVENYIREVLGVELERKDLG
ncbi:hypothetical protein [Kitasatospora azatica]|uniref:hypothetical protein n=1 Tax=Kitasatospora azatica TaxID=58347 RepID=UPI00055E03F4|nr:hypothetical protein [Kitasatospora azatica]